MDSDNKKMFRCSDEDFMAESDSMEELMKVGRMHVKERHGMDISDEDLMKEIKEV